jgi:non-heme chloroperoxidase
VARYIGRHGTQRVAKAVLIGAVPPLMLKTPANPAGTPMEAFDQIRGGVLADRSQFIKDLTMPQQTRGESLGGRAKRVLAAGNDGGHAGLLLLHQVFSETDLTEDLKKIDVPALILHGDDDQIVPIGASALLSAKLVKNAQFKIYKGGSHGMCTTQKDEVNVDLLSFIQS